MLKTMLAIWKTQKVGCLKNFQDNWRDLRDYNTIVRLGLRRKILGAAVVVTIAAQIRIVLANSTLDKRPPNISGPITPTADLAESMTP